MKGFKVLKSKKDYHEYLRTLPSDTVTFDCETTGLKVNSTLLGISLYDMERDPVFIPTDYFFSEGIPMKDIVEVSNEFFPKLQGIAHNGKYDLGIFKFNGIADINLIGDSSILVHSLGYKAGQELKLELLIAEEFSYRKKDFKEITGKKWDKIDWVKDVQSGLITLDTLAKYACEDVYWTYELYRLYRKKNVDDNTLKVHDKIEIPLVPVLRDMFVYGVPIDIPYLEEMGDRIDEHMKKLVDEIHNEAGCVFNINSGKQLGDVLFNKLGLPSVKKTKKGADSTDKGTMEKLADAGYPIAEALCKYSEIETLQTGFVRALPSKFIDFDGRVRCSLNSNGTTTGRFSCSQPNLQNQPNNKEFPVRNAYVAPPGYKILTFDYGQIELRIMGHAANDEKFIEAFEAKVDIHQSVADNLGITRDGGKMINFAVLYCLGAPNLAAKLKISEKAAQKIIDDYHTTYVGFAKWKTQTENFCKKHGYVRNIFGRVRHLPNVFSSNKGLHYGALRQAVNTPIQGAAADLIKIAMVKIANQIKERNWDAHLILQVHDEISLIVKDEIAVECFDMVKHTMENAVKLKVPIEADGKIITKWGDMKKKDEPGLYEAMKNGTYKPEVILPVQNIKQSLINQQTDIAWMTTLF